MARKAIKSRKYLKKDVILAEIRNKLGLSQAQLAAILGISRPFLALAESGKRTLQSSLNTLLINIYIQFHELETGSQASYRSLETRLFLNDEYRSVLPAMKLLEQDCRSRVKQLKKTMEAMKQRASDAEHAIIVFTTTIDKFRENNGTDEKLIAGIKLLKQQAYDNLLTCWEPEQAKLHGKIEALAGEARALRRYRVKVMREHDPFKNKK